MFKLEFYFLIDGNWKNVDYSISDRVPEKDDIVYYKTKSYRAVEVKEDDDHPNIFHVFLK